MVSEQLFILISFLLAWALSVIIKTIISSIKRKEKINIKLGFENGGMPSSHSAAVSSLTSAIFLSQGFSTLFIVSAVFSLIVISDAFKLRRNVGLQCESLNNLLSKNKMKQIKVVHGHTFVQVIGGILLGTLTSTIIFFII